MKNFKNKFSMSVMKNNVDTITLEDMTLEQVVEQCKKTDYSFGTYENNYRKQENFLGQDIIGLDIDSHHTPDEIIENAKEAGITVATVTTRNHNKIKNQGTDSEQPEAPRFRVLVPCQTRITKRNHIKRCANHMAKIICPNADKSCHESARLFYKSPNDAEVKFHMGKSFDPSSVLGSASIGTEPIKWKNLNKGWINPDIESEFCDGNFVTKCAHEFLRDAISGHPGCWNNKLYQAVKDLAKLGFHQDQIVSWVEGAAPSPLDDNDKRTIQSGIDAGLREKNESGIVLNKLPIPEVKSKSSRTLMNFLRGNNISFTNDLRWLINDRAVTEQEIYSMLNLYTEVSERKIKSFLQLFKSHAEKKATEILIEKIKFTKPNREVRRFVKSLTGKENENLSKLVMHLLQQTKRKIFGLKSDKQMMLILFGKTGSGKSVAMSRLLEILRPWVYENRNESV